MTSGMDAGDAPRARTLALVTYGEVGSSLIFALGVVALYALGVTPWVLLAVGLVVLLAAGSYAEGIAAVPGRGGAAMLVRRAFNDPAAFATGWMLFLDYLVVIALAALCVPHYLGAVTGWDALTSGPWDVVVGLCVVAGVTALRWMPAIRLPVLAVAAAATALAAQLLLATWGLVAILVDPDLHLRVTGDLGTAPSWTALIVALPFAMLAYTGLETAVNVASSAPPPSLRRGLVVGIGCVVVVNVAVACVGVSVTDDLSRRWLHAPLVGVAAAITGDAGAAARVLELVVGLTSALVLVTAIATATAGGERVAYALAGYDMLPHALARPERGTVPSSTAAVSGAAVAGVLLVLAGVAGRGVEFLAGLYSFGVLVALTAAQVAVVALRVREPDLHRPYRMPGNIRVGAVSLPLPAVAGALITAALWVAALATHDAIRIAGPAWLIIGVGVYLYSRRAGGEGLLSPATAPTADLVPGEVPRVERILVPLKFGAIGEEVLATALRLARAPDAQVDVVHVVKVPMDRPLDAQPDAAREAAARRAIDEAGEIAQEQGARIGGRVVRARSRSEAIVATALAVRADLIVMGSSPRWRAHPRFFSPLVDEVLRTAPCEVMVVSYPEGVVEEGGE